MGIKCLYKNKTAIQSSTLQYIQSENLNCSYETVIKNCSTVQSSIAEELNYGGKRTRFTNAYASPF